MKLLKTNNFIFSAFYDKRMIENCKVHTTPIGFYKREENNYTCYKCEVYGKYKNDCKQARKNSKVKRLK